MAEQWVITPHVYARGGLLLNDQLSETSTNYENFNFGAYGGESHMINQPLTEVTVSFKYGENFTYHYGFDTYSNFRFATDFTSGAKSLNERVNFLEFKDGNFSLWFGQRPYRSYPEFLSFNYTFDEKNLYGGGFRLDAIGPFNVALAYGVDEDELVDNGGVVGRDHNNLVMGKIEMPLENGIIVGSTEIQQLKRKSFDGENQGIALGYWVGLRYSRWGDKLLGGDLYNQFIVNYGKGYLSLHAMSSAFGNRELSLFNGDDFQPHKWLLQWNGDWKVNKFGLYWATFYQMHRGEDVEGQRPDSDYQWDTWDSYLRPQYGVLGNLSVGAEYARRIVMKEASQTPDWAINQGTVRAAAMLKYHWDDNYFGNPMISLFAGYMHKDKLVNFWPGDGDKNFTRFVRLVYEVSIN